jgi:hypothetical protein
MVKHTAKQQEAEMRSVLRVACFKLRPLYPRGERHWSLLVRRLEAPHLEEKSLKVTIRELTSAAWRVMGI